jgi:hypothetical protein
MGAWKLNEAKSKLNPGGSKNTIVHIRGGRRNDQSHGRRHGRIRKSYPQ